MIKHLPNGMIEVRHGGDIKMYSSYKEFLKDPMMHKGHTFDDFLRSYEQRNLGKSPG